MIRHCKNTLSWEEWVGRGGEHGCPTHFSGYLAPVMAVVIGMIGCVINSMVMAGSRRHNNRRTIGRINGRRRVVYVARINGISRSIDGRPEIHRHAPVHTACVTGHDGKDQNQTG